MKYILFLFLTLFLFSCKKERVGCTDYNAVNYDPDAVFSDYSMCNYNCSCGRILQQQLIVNPNWVGPIEDPDYLKFWVYSITIQNSCSDNIKKFVVDTDTLEMGEYICVDSLSHW